MIPAKMGTFVKSYKPPRYNIHRLINALVARPRPAFHPSAVVTTQKQFPDISYWQDKIDWDKMRSKTDTIIIRAGIGSAEDSNFRVNWSEAGRRGMYRGAYWFYNDLVSPGTQAQKFYEAIRIDPPEMELFCDWETTYGGKYAGLKNVVAFMEAVEAKMGRLKCTAFYTGFPWFYSNTNAITHASQYNFLKQRNLWLAWYTSDPAKVKIPAPWTRLHIWQFGTPVWGAEYGAGSKEIDMNFFNGTESNFYQYYGGEAPQPEPTGPQLTHTVRVYNDGSVEVN